MELSTEIIQQIENEADAITASFRDHSDWHAGNIQGYKYGYGAAGEKYAKKWQEAEAKSERYEKALKDIISPIAHLQRKAKEEGAGLDGHYAQMLANSVSFLQKIASEALTPKTSEDEK